MCHSQCLGYNQNSLTYPETRKHHSFKKKMTTNGDQLQHDSDTGIADKDSIFIFITYLLIFIYFFK